MALPRPTRFWPRLKWHDQMTISMTIMIFNIFNNGLSCPSLIADLCWFVEYFSGLPSTPIGLQRTIATIVKRLWISKISRHRYHRYHCPSRGHRGPPPIRRFAFTSTTCFCPVSGSISEKRRHALSFAAEKRGFLWHLWHLCFLFSSVYAFRQHPVVYSLLMVGSNPFQK